MLARGRFLGKLFGLPFLLVFLIFVAGCSFDAEAPRSNAEIAAALVPNDGPSQLTLLTSINARSGSGAHSALIIDAQERVIFDPAGAFRADSVVRRGDVIWNPTAPVIRAFYHFQGSDPFYISLQTLPVSSETAQRILKRVVANGQVRDALCTQSISSILAEETDYPIRRTWFPGTLRKQVSKIDQAKTRHMSFDSAGNLVPNFRPSK